MMRVVTDLKCQLIASFLLAAKTEGRVISAVVGYLILFVQMIGLVIL